MGEIAETSEPEEVKVISEKVKVKRSEDGPTICIVGTGFSGLCAAIQLKRKLKVDSFTIFEENDEVGGTWLVNTYPGCSCDIPSHMYSFSFEIPNPYWSQVHAPQPEILDYLKNVTRKYKLYSKIKFQHKVLSAEWNEEDSTWLVTVLDKNAGVEKKLEFDLLILATGPFHLPNFPKEFEPFHTAFHTARWDHSVDLEGKIVAVVGSGASGAQVIPSIVDKVKTLLVYQRSPTWVMPKIDYKHPDWLRWCFVNLPGLQWGVRSATIWAAEVGFSAWRMNNVIRKLTVAMCKHFMKAQVQDPEVLSKVTPKHRFGCTRAIHSSDFYPSLSKPNVKIITSKIKEVSKDAILTEDGNLQKPDVLILASGFKVQENFQPMKVTGKDGVDLYDKWHKGEDGACVYAGLCCNHAPNMFYIVGPTTGVTYSSLILSIEYQVEFLIKVVKEMKRRRASCVAVKKEAEVEYMRGYQEATKDTAWGASPPCYASYLLDHRGKNTSLWPGPISEYGKFTEKVDFTVFKFN